jgi:predicted Rossmann-fold nucleotide-binding protein
MLTQHWVLVAGTGRQSGLPASVSLLAGELGRSLAENSYGLVVGGWPGVDYMTSRAYAEVLQQRGLALSDNLIQVVAAHRPVVFPEGADSKAERRSQQIGRAGNGG